MAVIDDLLNKLAIGQATNELLRIDRDARTITIPPTEQVFGVVCDAYSESKYFGVSRNPTTDIDLADSLIFITWVVMAADGSADTGISSSSERKYDANNMVFKWTLEPDMFRHSGTVIFSVHFHGPDSTKWHSTEARGTILNGQLLDDTLSPEDEERAQSFVDQLINQLYEASGGAGTSGGGSSSGSGSTSGSSVSVTTALSSGTRIADITVNGVKKTLYAPSAVTDSHINELIDAKLNEIEAYADDILGVL